MPSELITVEITLWDRNNHGRFTLRVHASRPATIVMLLQSTCGVHDRWSWEIHVATLAISGLAPMLMI